MPNLSEVFRRPLRKKAPEEAPRTPICGLCGKLIEPGQPVGEALDIKPDGDQNITFHMGCCPDNTLHRGSYSPDGELVSDYPRGMTAGEYHASQRRKR